MDAKQKSLNKNLNICITGASGFIGSHLVEELLSRGYKVRILTRKKYVKNTKKNLSIFKGDLLKPDSTIEKFLFKCDVLYHCAGELNNKNSMYKLHVEGTKNLLYKFASSPLGLSKSKHFIQLSSVGAYGKFYPSSIRRFITEKDPEAPDNIYEKTKTLSDKKIKELSVQNNISYTILRPTNVVGPNMKNMSFFSLINSIKTKKFFYIGSTESIMTYIHVEDVVNALILCALCTKSKNQVFIISNDCTLKQIVDSVISKGNINYSPFCLPEFFVRFVSFILCLFIPFPLTSNRINYLISRTSYSSKKIQKYLHFYPIIDIPKFAASRVNNSIRGKG